MTLGQGRFSFEFSETMSGNYHLLSAASLDERAISLRPASGAKVDGHSPVPPKTRPRGSKAKSNIEGFADKRPLRGTLWLKLFDEQRLTYDFTFDADDGRRCRFHGQKDVTMIDLFDTMTTLPASIYDAAGSEIARAVLRFDLHGSLRPFLRSWRPRYGS